ncbi:phytanoyl-CoA dioxygenase [Histoplasma capsulatum G186AR]|uniref:Phytanoyl-CoA dioxygenase n=1 Tax=Ajellomyces capsulatus (strain G186AR / H82 / ATCC MYA-2454 / RMSCC 2432) TaxID=447093 RepID=C0NZN9_AJECG|nr:phytanoyl-CoA dioxygenase [Histoplasma capsulatum G186AR]EEH03287.1 phytanoyl-CoA dioxygenase [Histoplasma capsulatum G186AR]
MAAPGLEMQLQALGMIKGNLPTDPVDRANVEHCLRHGYVVLENCVTKEEVTVAKAEIDRLSGADPMKGRNTFEGLNTNRIYSLLNKTRVFDKFVILPRVLALNDYFLDTGYNITAFHTIQINPGEDAQGMHHAFDEFTADNGATRVVPGSHLWGADRRPEYEESTPMVCPQGSVVYFLATTWHCGGPNNSPNPRKSLTVQYCQPYIRQIENQILAVDPRRLAEIPQRIVEMMGYRIHAPFIGYADGLNPVSAVRRMVNWLQAPLDPNPPAFTSKSGTAGIAKL